MSDVVLELRDIEKTFAGGVTAVRGVSITLRAGEIQALVGENGAGKTTLATIAAGKLAPTAGTVHAAGAVGLVHQHFELIGRLRVWENIVLGAEPRDGLRLDRNAARERVRALAQQTGFELDPDAVVEELPVGVAQRVELLRELSRAPVVLLLDEPTAVLAPAEIESFFAMVHTLAARGVGVLIITHKLQEVIAHTSRVTVMRAGRVVAEYLTAQTTVDEIARTMVGGALPQLAARSVTSASAAPGLAARNLSSGSGAHALRGVSFEVSRGEIVGIAGVEGNGQTALADAIAGVASYEGALLFNECALRPLDLRARQDLGIRVIPQDRTREALIPPWSIAQNVALGDQRRAFARGIRIDYGAVRERARAIVAAFDVRTASIETPVRTLSGGNQQKVVAGRALLGAPAFVLAYQPTRGVDVGAAALLQSRLIEARNTGVAVLLISFELDEIFALADRILVLYRGHLRGEFVRDTFDRGRIGALMAGAA
ncbi:MAG TPA: ABC transporter ATP-binding protein [Candidatus Acidoferrales bacterium]|nr:ABC transporter ATP-binding protein [Candidatus Acidoferrales bacterium]